MSGYSTFDVQKALDIERECLRQWLNKGSVWASIEQASGVGTKNLFSRSDVYQIALLQRLISMGITRNEASIYTRVIRMANKFPKTDGPDLETLKKQAEQEDKSLYFIVKGPPKKGGGILGMEYSVEAISDPAELVELITSNAIIVNLTALCQEVDEALEKTR